MTWSSGRPPLARVPPLTTPAGDQAQVQRAAAGDRRAQAELYEQHVDGAWRRLGRMLGPDSEREDLVQQAFLEVFRGLGRFRGEASFATYLGRVLVNLACDHLRRRGRRPPLSDQALEDLTAPGASPERDAENRERLRLIWSLLDRIAPKKRIAFVLSEVEGLSLPEVAAVMDISADTARKRVDHAQRELRAMLQRRGEAP
jgi:RNA polymerase sigma-70 factor, ECF subfamily